jgi:hypothetical protein
MQVGCRLESGGQRRSNCGFSWGSEECGTRTVCYPVPNQAHRYARKFCQKPHILNSPQPRQLHPDDPVAFKCASASGAVDEERDTNPARGGMSMRHRWFAIAALAATVGPGLTNGSVRAQQAAPLPPGSPPVQSAPAAAPPQVDQRPWTVIDHGPTGVPPGDPQAPAEPTPATHRPFVQWWESRPKPLHDWVDNRPKPVLEAVENHPKPIQDWWHEYPKHCWSHHNACLCGSFHSELTFIFGSCRDFFGEPCLAGPPRSVYPGAYDRTLFPKMSRQPDGSQPPVPGQPPGPPTGYPNGGPTVGYGAQGQGGPTAAYPFQGYTPPAYPAQSGVPGCSRCQ